MKEVVAKHQHVPVDAWFLTGVTLILATSVNWYPPLFSCANVADVPANNAANAMNFAFILFFDLSCYLLCGCVEIRIYFFLGTDYTD